VAHEGLNLVIPAASPGVDATDSYLPAPWLTPDVGRIRSRIVRSSCAGVLVMEEPPGSNRGPGIEPLLRWAGVPESEIIAGRGYWCAAWAARQWHDAGAEVLRTASCWRLLEWGQRTGRFSRHVPSLGAFVFYAHDAARPGYANHVGVVVRLLPQLASVEGNTTIEGRGDERNGTAVATKLIRENGPGADPVLGYVHVFPTPTT
jgi:hypothetical protein